MSELDEIKHRLEAIRASNNGCVNIEDVKNAIAFIEGLIYEKENKDETK